METKLRMIPKPPTCFCGLDLGQSCDYSAAVVVERTETAAGEWRFLVGYIKRWPLKTAYHRICADVIRMLQRPELRRGDPPHLIVDQSGVGAPVIEMLDGAHDFAEVTGVVITGGASESREGSTFYVAKRNLISGVEVAFQAGRLEIARGLAERETLKTEVQDFRVRITDSANDVYGARTGAHDDLVLALCLAVWKGSKPDFIPMMW